MSNKLKILVLNYEYPPIGGGGGIISKYISEGLSEIGHDITIITTWFENLPEEESNNNLTIIRLKSKRKNNFRSNPLEMLSWISYSKQFLKKHCQKNQFDICIANFAIPGGNVAKYILKIFNIPYVIISHGHDIPWVKPVSLYFSHFLNYLKIISICKKSLANFIQTAEMKANIDGFCKEYDKNILIPNGFDKNMFYPNYEKHKKGLKILFVGRLVKQKDPLTLLKAIKIFSDKHEDFTLNILGDGPLRKKMEKFIDSNNLKDNVKILGKIPYSKMIEEYQSASVLIAPSISEGMSISIIEALACGLYVITTPASGNSELISDRINGEIVNYQNSEQVADILEKYYTNKYLLNYFVPEKFQNDFKNKFNWENIIDKYDKKLKQVVTR